MNIGSGQGAMQPYVSAGITVSDLTKVCEGPASGPADHSTAPSSTATRARANAAVHKARLPSAHTGLSPSFFSFLASSQSAPSYLYSLLWLNLAGTFLLDSTHELLVSGQLPPDAHQHI